MKIISNRFDLNTIQEINTILSAGLPTERKSYHTIYDVPGDIDIRDRLPMLLDRPGYENTPVVLLACERIVNKEQVKDGSLKEYIEYKSKFFPSDWKLVPRLLKSKHTTLWFMSPTDYILVLPGLRVARSGIEGICRVINSIILDMKHPLKLMDHHLLTFLTVNCKLEPEQAKKRIQQFEQLFYTNKEFVNRTEIIFDGLDVSDLSIVDETVRKASDLDRFKAKLLYVLYFQQTRDHSMIKQFRGVDEANELERSETQHNAKEQAEIFIDACARFLNLTLDVEDIYEDIEEQLMDTNFLNAMYGDNTDANYDTHATGEDDEIIDEDQLEADIECVSDEIEAEANHEEETEVEAE